MSGTPWTEEDLELLGLLNTTLNLPTWATAKLLDRSQWAVALKRYSEEMPRPARIRQPRKRELQAAESRRGEAQARLAAAKLPGISVRRYKCTWAFQVTLHTTNRRYKRYAGKDVDRAIALRSELIATYAKKAPAAFRLPA